VAKQATIRVAAVAAMLLLCSVATPGAAAQTYPYPQQGYPQGGYSQVSYPTDPYSQYSSQYYGPTDPYSQYYGQSGGGYYGGYAPQQYGGAYGQGYNPYGYGAGGYGGTYAPPPTYNGYGSAYGPYYGAQYQPSAYYGQPPASQPPPYYGAYAPPYTGQSYVDPNLLTPPLGLPYAPPPVSNPSGFPLTATLSGPGQATLTWNAIPGAVSYAIYQSVNNGALQFASTSTSTSATVPLNYGGMSFQVRALGSGGAELLSSNVATPAPGAVAGPGVPQNYLGCPGVPNQSNSSVTANIQQGSLYLGTQITVRVADSGGAPVTGRFVALQSSRGGVDNVQPANGSTPVTDGSGRAFFTARASQPGQATFTATVDGYQVGQTLVNFQ
jgi:hypothetical protein